MRGRAMTASDMAAGAPPVVVIDERLANLAWPGEDPIGKRLSTWTREVDVPEWREVVGVVGDVRSFGPDTPPTPELFLPYTQPPVMAWRAFQGSMALVVRAGDDPAGFRVVAAKCGPVGGFVASSVRRGDDGRGARRGCGQLAIQHLAAVLARRNRSRAGCGRHLRRHRVLRDAAHARDRPAAGPRRDPTVSAADGGAPRSDARECRHRARTDCGTRATRMVTTCCSRVSTTDPPTYAIGAARACLPLPCSPVPCLRCARCTSTRCSLWQSSESVSGGSKTAAYRDLPLLRRDSARMDAL